MGYLVAAYAVFWAITFVLVFSISARQKKLQQELDALKSHQRQE
ncbi:MAG: CcmD family protein [Chloroflexota bacterium]